MGKDRELKARRKAKERRARDQQRKEQIAKTLRAADRALIEGGPRSLAFIGSCEWHVADGGTPIPRGLPRENSPEHYAPMVRALKETGLLRTVYKLASLICDDVDSARAFGIALACNEEGDADTAIGSVPLPAHARHLIERPDLLLHSVMQQLSGSFAAWVFAHEMRGEAIAALYVVDVAGNFAAWAVDWAHEALLPINNPETLFTALRARCPMQVEQVEDLLDDAFELKAALEAAAIKPHDLVNRLAHDDPRWIRAMTILDATQADLTRALVLLTEEAIMTEAAFNGLVDEIDGIEKECRSLHRTLRTREDELAAVRATEQALRAKLVAAARATSNAPKAAATSLGERLAQVF